MKSLFAYLFTKSQNHLPLSVMIVISIILFYFLTTSISPFFVPLEHQPAQAQSPDITTGLVGYWKFDEGSGTTASDSSGNNNHGTLVNGPTWTTGKVGQALEFDGGDDIVKTTTSPISPPITISIWVKYITGGANDDYFFWWANSGAPITRIHGSWNERSFLIFDGVDFIKPPFTASAIQQAIQIWASDPGTLAKPILLASSTKSASTTEP